MSLIKQAVRWCLYLLWISGPIRLGLKIHRNTTQRHLDKVSAHACINHNHWCNPRKCHLNLYPISIALRWRKTSIWFIRNNYNKTEKKRKNHLTPNPETEDKICAFFFEKTTWLFNGKNLKKIDKGIMNDEQGDKTISERKRLTCKKQLTLTYTLDVKGPIVEIS